MPNFNLQPFEPSGGGINSKSTINTNNTPDNQFAPDQFAVITSPYQIPLTGLLNIYKFGIGKKEVVNEKFPHTENSYSDQPSESNYRYLPSYTYDEKTDENSDRSDRLKASYLTNDKGDRNKVAEAVKFIAAVKDTNYDINGINGISGDFVFERCIITCEQAKNIITTSILGKNGTVKEYIGLNDYEISLDVMIFGKNGLYPRDKVDALRKYLTYQFAINIECPYLNKLGINYIVIRDFDVSMEEGGISQQRVHIRALSDSYYESDIFSPYQN